MIRFVAEASMTRGGEELHEDNRKMVPIISESTTEERKESRSTTIEEEILKIISELVMAGRTSGIKTAADFFPELRIMQINTFWKDNSKYFPMSMALFSGMEYISCGNQIKSTVISVYFQIEPF
jgi:hypothetical protein